MAADRPFVVTIASEQAQVGKTTIASNLAVYLKALREDLPVTLVSFDSHFSADGMFAIGDHRGRSIAGLFSGRPAAELIRLGQYGVQFMTTESCLCPFDDDHHHLLRALRCAFLPGILVLDTRPDLDYFTRNALLAADLILVPVMDSGSLAQVASLRRASGIEDGAADRIWLVPSLVDEHRLLRPGLNALDFMVFAAGERGCQVADCRIHRSAQLAGLSNPLLTHDLSSQTHQQLRKLADIVLQHYGNSETPVRSPLAGELSIPQSPRCLQVECPLCSEPAGEASVHFFLDLRSRRRGFVHGSCLDDLLQDQGLGDPAMDRGLWVLRWQGAGEVGPEAELTLQIFDEQGAQIDTAEIGAVSLPPFAAFWRRVTGKLAEELFQETMVVTVEHGLPGDFCGPERQRLRELRRQVLTELNGGLFKGRYG